MATERPIIVFKVGTSSLIHVATGSVRLAAMARIVEAAVRLAAAGFRIVLVTSGAVGLGCSRLGFTDKPSSIARKQAAAAVGQVRLMTLYDDAFSVLGARCAQVLLTYDTFGDRNQYLNARNTFLELLALGVVPIVNENDTVAVQEIRVGDNDSLSALVAAMIGARWLFLLTDVEALYDCNPTEVTDAHPLRSVAMPFIQHLRKQMLLGAPRLMLTEDVAAYAAASPGGARADAAVALSSSSSSAGVGKAGSKFGTGGMVTKLKAAQLGTAAGVTVVITRTDSIDTIAEMLERRAAVKPARKSAGNLSAMDAAAASAATPAPASASPSIDALRGIPESIFIDAGIGTTFLASSRPVTGRKRWIMSLATDGALVLDAGAVSAVAGARKSLFPAGVVAVHGDFDVHDAVALLAPDGHEVARALVNYSCEDCRRLCGKPSKDISVILGYLGAETLADRDNIVVLKDKPSRTDAEPAE